MDIGDLAIAEMAGSLVFLSIFHVIGGVALGTTLRGWVSHDTRKSLGNRVFFLVWGGMFGCMPLAFGLENGLPMLAAQMMVLSAAIVGSFFWLDRLRELTSDPNVIATGFGGVFLVAGLAAGGFLLREREWLMAGLFGGLFGLVGGGVFYIGLRNLLRGSSEGE